MIFPKPLKKGDTIGIIAPASSFDSYKLKDIEYVFNKLGYKLVFGESCYSSYKSLAGEDTLRAKDIEDMFCNKNIKAIICLRGGYGTPRILSLIDYNIIKNNPKIFIGYSDITALHIAFNKYCNLCTFHGIMAGNSPSWDDYSFNSLIDAINMKESLDIKNPNNEKIYTINEGVCKGQIIGGNLSLVSSTIGTPYEIDVKGKILFLEEVSEYTYKIDRMLTQLELANKFEECSGIIFGDFYDCKKQKEEDFELIELFIDKMKNYNKPCIYNLKSGHCNPMISIPFGVNAILDANSKKIKLYK